MNINKLVNERNALIKENRKLKSVLKIHGILFKSDPKRQETDGKGNTIKPSSSLEKTSG
jgi:hypothetical protein